MVDTCLSETVAVESSFWPLLLVIALTASAAADDSRFVGKTDLHVMASHLSIFQREEAVACLFHSTRSMDVAPTAIPLVSLSSQHNIGALIIRIGFWGPLYLDGPPLIYGLARGG